VVRRVTLAAQQGHGAKKKERGGATAADAVFDRWSSNAIAEGGEKKRSEIPTRTRSSLCILQFDDEADWDPGRKKKGETMITP